LATSIHILPVLLPNKTEPLCRDREERWVPPTLEISTAGILLSCMRSSPHEQNGKTVRLIGALKLAKGVLLVAMGVGAFSLLHKDLEATLTNLVQHLSVDPESRYFQALVSRLDDISPKLPLVAIGTLCYGALFCVEGVGLLMLKRWAEYLTVFATGSFIPLEIYEIIKHQSPIKITILVLNVAIVIYLIVRLRGERHSQPRVAFGH
jgi:uncharacterized membrane protein (DUF2068 family)